MANTADENKSSFIRDQVYPRGPFIAKLLISFSILGYLAHVIDWQGLVTRIAGVDFRFFVAAVLVMSVPILLTSLRWQIILRSQSIVIPIRKVISFDLTALFFNSILPGATGGDMIRAIMAIRMHPREKTRIVLSLVADRGIGLLVLMSWVWLILWMKPDLLWRSTLLESIADFVKWTTLAAVVVFLVLALTRRLRMLAWQQRLLQFLRRNALLEKFFLFVSPFLSRPLLLTSLAVVTVVSYSCNFLSGYLLALSLHLSMTYVQVIVLLAVVTIAISVPVSVGGHGVREIVMIGMFTALAVTVVELREAAIAYSILLFAIQLIWSLIGGAYFLAHRVDLGTQTLTPSEEERVGRDAVF